MAWLRLARHPLAAFGAAVALALGAASTSAQTQPPAPFCELDADTAVAITTEAQDQKAVLHVGFYAHFKPMSYSADEDEDSPGFNDHRGYEADLLTALEALNIADVADVSLSFVRSGIAGWAEAGVTPIWRRAALPEYDIVVGGITILDSRTRDDAGEPIVAFTQPHVAFRQSLLVRSEDAARLAEYANLTSDVDVGVLAGTTGEARLLQITGLADQHGVLAAGTRIETPAGTVTADGGDAYRITSAQQTDNLNGRRRLHPPADTMPTVVYFGAETDLLQALRDDGIDAVARGELGNRDAASAEGGRFVVTAVDAQAEYGGFVVDVQNTALLGCLNETISWLTNGRRIGFAEWHDNNGVFMDRAELWNKLNEELTLEADTAWTRNLEGLFPSTPGDPLRFTATSDDRNLADPRVDEGGKLTIEPGEDVDPDEEVRIAVTATDGVGNRVTLRLIAKFEPAHPRLLQGWRLPWLTGEISSPPPDPGGWVPGVFEDASAFKNRCQNPRPRTYDVQGQTLDENNWLRSWSNDTYLWYDEIWDRDPSCCTTPDYFRLLKTDAVTPSGRPRDRFHFTYDTAEWQDLSQSGVSAGYGARLIVVESRPPRDIRVAYTEPNSPATRPGVALKRGTRILEIDGVDVRRGDDLATLNAGLFPALGATHEFVVQDPGSAQERTVRMQATTITADPVKHEDVLSTDTGPVGYMLFNDHTAIAEPQLIEAVRQFQAAGITDLVLDLRYNGGGWLDIASRLAAMIAGRKAVGRTFEELQFNRKHRDINPVTGRRLLPVRFETVSANRIRLPALNLERLFVLTGPRTCSASESIINGLRGIDVEVVLIGATTCGKPYGFYPTDNCGTTYFTVQFRGVNAKGFGDFGDGFSPANVTEVEGVEIPGCAVFDDFDHQFGDPAEARLKAALQYRVDGSCPAPSSVKPGTETIADSPRADAEGLAVREFALPGLKVLDW